MKRTDRLQALVQLLRDRGELTAAYAAQALGVSDRTIYRDMETLMASGLPVDGTRGLGYRLTAPVSLPPLNLSLVELEALHLGLAVVSEAADPELKAASESLTAKIEAVLGEDSTPDSQLAIYPLNDTPAGFRHMPTLRAAIRARQKLQITYRDITRIIRPLQLDYWGRIWTVTAWCELRRDFRSFRVERITEIQLLPELFMDEPGKTLADFLDNAGDA